MVLNKIISRLKNALKLYKTIGPYLGNILPLFIAITIALIISLLASGLITFFPNSIEKYRIILYVVFFFVLFAVFSFAFFSGLIKTKILKTIIEENKKNEKVDDSIIEKYKDTKYFTLIKKFPAYLLGIILVFVILFFIIGLDIFLNSVITNTIITEIINYIFIIISIALLPVYLDFATLPIHSKDFEVKTKQIKDTFFNIWRQFKKENVGKYLEKLMFCFTIIIFTYLVVLIISFVYFLALILIIILMSFTITCLVEPF